MKFLQEHKIGLSIFRVLLSFLIIRNAAVLYPMAKIFFATDGLMLYDSYIRSISQITTKLTYPFNDTWTPSIFLLTMVLVAFLFMIGFLKRFIGVLLILFLFIFQRRGDLFLDGSDNLMYVVLPFLIFADAYKYFTVNLLSTVKIQKVEQFKNLDFIRFLADLIKKVSLLGLMIQVCYVYFFTAMAKIHTDVWYNGTALYYALKIKDFEASAYNAILVKNLYFVQITTYATLLFELAFPFLIWFKKTRPLIIVIGILFHVGIWFLMGLNVYPWMMISTYSVFLTDDEYLKIYNTYSQLRNYIFIKRRPMA